jgi:uncharacterized protein YgiM (DUF1202 family)
MQTKGQFILFDNITEFKEWLLKTQFTRKIDGIQQHHTYLPDYKTFKGNNHFKILENVDKYHETHGFSDSAQNLMTFPDGKLAVCRDFNKTPAGIYKHNDGDIVIENVGNFDVDIMSEAQRNTIIDMTSLLCFKFNVPINTDVIIYHHWFDLNTGERTNGLKGVTKTCPGVKFFGGNKVPDAEKNFIPLIQQRVNELKGGVSPMSKKVIITADKLNVRQLPVSGAVLGQFIKDQIVEVYENTNGWYRVVFESKNGFISASYVKDYVEVVKPVEPPKEETVPKKQYDVLNEELKQIKVSCKDLEGQINSYKTLVKELELVVLKLKGV